MILIKNTLFQAGEGGYYSYRIPAIAVVPWGELGTVLAFCAARRGRGGDWDRNDVVVRRSTDGGETWGPLTVVGTDPEHLADNPAPIVDRDGSTVHLLYQVNYARVYYRRSDDAGQRWSHPVEITTVFEPYRAVYDWKVVAPGPGHGIQVRRGQHAGRLIVPVWLCKPDPTVRGGDHRPSCVTTVYSDDGGRTWERGEIVVDTSPRVPNPSETTAVELADGRVLLNIRSESDEHRRLVTISADGATGWSEPRFDPALYEPVCFGSLLSLRYQPGGTAGEDLLLFSNPDSRHLAANTNALNFRSRENLTIALSRDGGRTWPVARVIEPGVAGYSDVGEGPDGTIFCLYEGGLIERRRMNAYIACARLGLDWLTQIPAR